MMYAIRHKPTGHFLPQGRGRSGRGFTHSEPVALSEQAPRLFFSPQAAKIALGWWLKGKLTVTAGEVDFYSGEELGEDWSTEPCPERRREDMEVVLCWLQFGEVVA